MKTADLVQQLQGLPADKRLVLLRRLRDAGVPILLSWGARAAEATSLPDLHQEVYLADAIRPRGAVDSPEEVKSVLLTGATGFLGAFLLSELLDATRSRVYCLVRCKSPQEGLARLAENLRGYELAWTPERAARVQVIPADLERPLLGLTPGGFSELAGQVQRIYHNGARLNFLDGYEAFIGVNVVGTQEVLRLACTGAPKALHHVSTLFCYMFGAHEGAPGSLKEQVGPIPGTPPFGGYNQSKWVGERLVALAGERGLPVTVYRPGLILGSSETGACSPNEIFVRTLRGTARLGLAPQFPAEATMEHGPVDIVAKAIVHLSGAGAASGRAYHLVSERPAPLFWATSPLKARGHDITEVEPDVWREALLDSRRVDREHPFHPLVPWLTASWPGGRHRFCDPLLGRPQVETGVGHAELARAGIVFPPLELTTDKTIARYVHAPSGAAK